MKKAIIGKKVGMAQIFEKDGKVIPVTVLEAGPCPVIQKKTVEKEGYASVQLGFVDIAEKKLSKGELGHLKKADAGLKKELREFRLDECDKFEVGDVITADLFEAGEYVDITGISKGHGYSGVVKRWGQAVQCHTHGVGPIHRSPGSMGANTDPSRVMPGKRLAGHYGVEQVTVQNLRIAKVDPELNIIAVCGAVPGPKGSIVEIKTTTKIHRAKNTVQTISTNPQKKSARG